jgi:hypothetical protein
MRPEFLEPNAGVITAELLKDVLSLVDEGDTTLPLDKLSPMERLMLYDWAMREHIKAGDGDIRRRSRPFLLTAYEPSSKKR